MSTRSQAVDDGLTNATLIAIFGVFVLAIMLRAAGSMAAFATGSEQPSEGLAAGLRVVAQPRTPGPALGASSLSAVAYWCSMLVLVALLIGLLWTVWVLVSRGRHRSAHDPSRIHGTATSWDIDDTASEKALLRRGHTLRPSLTHPKARDVGYLLGKSHGRGVWASVEDSILVIGPPRSGKGLHLVVNAILDAPGAVVTTSTRPDNLAATIRERRDVGPVAVFDPQRLTAGLTDARDVGVRWSPIRGCEDPLTAMIRATGLASSTGLSAGGTESGGFWEGRAHAVIQALLHAAALDRLPTRVLFEWSLSATAAMDAVGILASHGGAAPGWADSIHGMIHSDPRTRDSIWMAVSQAMASLADPKVLDAVSPSPGDEFDPTHFLTNNGTLYLLATGAGAGAAWPLVAAFLEDLTETARHLAAASPGTRLDPPLLLALDEIGNLAPLPSLPVLMAEGGGTGITTMPVLQSLSQARARWGEHAASTIWDASIVKVILGGASASKDLQELSVLIGERDDPSDTVTINEHGARSIQRSTRRRHIMPPEQIRMLPFGTGLVLLRSAPPIVVRLRSWHSR
ncbi:TraM recognition domain-containing protein [Nocardioides jishulii]|uniref:Type IV secretory system conjugative DNA transfer family protein n=1 Tax=Nocardioides jishulii TaxID=2575440 RepID=A0A4U2YNF6_9ACTN|nr:TraM recognition domain-containing protein [Nocardioides jishulii]QCX27734.1 type IV secretory system conjugative DNA transfer family protein [Nocardioides jishulii]TKI62540.1 type IV secretory system conjugative DNA transfer family protein [Nocardioides jishulii]